MRLQPLKKNRKLVICSISGHTDNIGDINAGETLKKCYIYIYILYI